MRFFIFLAGCLWAARVSSQHSTNSSFTPIDSTSRKCIDSSECRELDMRSCNCAVGQICIQTERTCEVCSQLTCVLEKEQSRSVLVPIIAGSVVAGVILLLGSIVSLLYFRNREEVTARGGVVAYIKYKAHRDSILQRDYTDNQVLLSKRSSALSETKRSSAASMFLTAKSQNMNTRVQPKVMVLGDDSGSMTSFDASQEKQPEAPPEPLPYDGPSIRESVLDAPARDSFGMSSFGLDTSFQPTTIPAVSRTSRVYSTSADSQYRPLSTDSFATQILSNPLVSAGLVSSPPSSISSAFFAAQGAAQSSPLSLPPPSADPRNSQVLPSEDSIILNFK